MNKIVALLFFCCCTLNVFSQHDNPFVINWPAEFDPAKTKFYAHNEIEINAKPEVVWQILANVLEWPKWYKGAEDIFFMDESDTILTASSVFSWKTMELNFVSTIKLFEPYSHLEWKSENSNITTYQAWLIIPTKNGCKVITDETHNGYSSLLEKKYHRRKLERLHEVWLKELKNKAENFNK